MLEANAINIWKNHSNQGYRMGVCDKLFISKVKKKHHKALAVDLQGAFIHSLTKGFGTLTMFDIDV